MSETNVPKSAAEPSELPAEILDFLNEVIQGSLIRYDVLRFFHGNPYSILTISDLSVWVSREERPLADALQQLAAKGYLAQSHASSAFVLTMNQEKRSKLERFFTYMEVHPEEARRLRVTLRGGIEEAR